METNNRRPTNTVHIVQYRFATPDPDFIFSPLINNMQRSHEVISSDHLVNEHTCTGFNKAGCVDSLTQAERNEKKTKAPTH